MKARNGLRVGDVVTIKSRISKNYNRKAIVTAFTSSKVTVLPDTGSNCKLSFASKNLKKICKTEWPDDLTAFDDWIVESIENKLLKHPQKEGQGNRNCLNYYHWVLKFGLREDNMSESPDDDSSGTSLLNVQVNMNVDGGNFLELMPDTHNLEAELTELKRKNEELENHMKCIKEGIDQIMVMIRNGAGQPTAVSSA